MEDVKSLLLVLLSLLWPMAAQAQEVASKVQVIEVAPQLFLGNSAPAGQIQFDLILGANPRPAWWGQSFGSNEALPANTIEAHLDGLRGKDGVPVPISVRSIAAYRPMWKEEWQTYIVPVEINLQDAKWPRVSSFRLSGVLKLPFAGQNTPDASVPFSLSIQLQRDGTTMPVLVQPNPQLWVKAVRVLRRTSPQTDRIGNRFEYEAQIVVVNRIFNSTNSTGFMPVFLDAMGAPISGFGTRGSSGGLGTGDVSGPNDSIEFSTYRVVWDERFFDSSPTISIRQTIDFNKRSSFSITFPAKRDGKLLEGEVAPGDWKIEAPVSN